MLQKALRSSDILLGAVVGVVLMVSVLSCVEGCASWQTNLTPTQRLYVLEGEFKGLQSVALSYCTSPIADEKIKDKIKRASQRCTDIITQFNEGYQTVTTTLELLDPVITDLKNSVKETWIQNGTSTH